MRGFAVTLRIVIPFALLACAASTAIGGTMIELLNPPPGGLLELAIGESYTFDIQITSDDPFVLAMATFDAYYPGRYLRGVSNETAHHSASALLHVTVVGRGSTVDLPAVYDWPEPGIDWQEGTCPFSIVGGVRHKGGMVVSERFSFTVAVP